jgi:transposase
MRTSGRTQKSIANELGIDRKTLRDWREALKKAENEGTKAFPGKEKARDEGLALLRKRVADLEETNEVLKKAIAIFTVKTPR